MNDHEDSREAFEAQLAAAQAELTTLRQETTALRAAWENAEAEALGLREALKEIYDWCSKFDACPIGPDKIADIARAALAKKEDAQ